VTVVAPVASPAALGGEAAGVRVFLRDAAGATWDEADAMLTAAVADLVGLAGRLADAGPLLDALAARLTRALPATVENLAATEAGEGELADYARARAAAAPELQASLDRRVTEPLLRALDELGPARRARKVVRDLLGA